MTCDKRYTFALPFAEWLLVLAVLTLLITSSTVMVSAHQSHPNGTLRLAWQSEHISRVTAVDLDARTSGAALFRATGPARVEQRDGRSCVVGALLLFDVDDAFAFNIDETVSVELVLDREFSNGVVSYHDRAVLRPQTQTVRFTDAAPRWQSVTLTLERARFANRLLTAADFGLAAPGGDLVAPQPGDSTEIAVCGVRLKREGKSALHTGRQARWHSKSIMRRMRRAEPSLQFGLVYTTRRVGCRYRVRLRLPFGAGRTSVSLRLS